MLTISASQLDALTSAGRSDFVDRMCEHLAQHYAPELLLISPERLHAAVDAAVRRADAFQLETERDCCRYLHLCAILGWDHHERPDDHWINAALGDPLMGPPEQRLDVVFELSARKLEAEDPDEE